MSIVIAIPCYNSADTISDTIEDALRQTYTDFEVLIYDDGSTDETAEIAETFRKADSRVKIFRCATNKGRSFARNFLLNEAGDRYISWQDSDDLYHPEKLARQLRFYEETKDSSQFEKFIITSPFERRRPTARRVGVSRSDEMMQSEMFRVMVPPFSYDVRFIYSKEFLNYPFYLMPTFGPANLYLEAGGFDNDLPWFEDLDIALKLLRSGTKIIGHRDGPPLFYYSMGSPGTSTSTINHCLEILFERFEEFAVSQGIDVRDYRIWRRQTSLFSTMVRKGEFEDAFDLLFEDMKTANLHEATHRRMKENLRMLASFLSDEPLGVTTRK